mgnify:CR=1 FL=1
MIRNSYTSPDTQYDTTLVVDDAYVASLPDLQDGDFKGARVAIPHVGIHRFRVPLTIARRDGGSQIVEASITGTVSLESEKKGINMSRIIRTFYEHCNTNHGGTFTLKALETVLQDIRKRSGELNAELLIKFSYPILQPALRTQGLIGYQYYDVLFRLRVVGDEESSDSIYHAIEFDFVYSSACPCSYELAEHARAHRNQATVSHSQRSVARVQLKLDSNQPHIWIEEIQELCTDALHTETQVMVKRADEQAFAELNGSYTKFVEDAARQLYHVFDAREDIYDFRIVCSHLESLHSHDAIAVITKYATDQTFPDAFANSHDVPYMPDLSYHELQSLVR